MPFARASASSVRSPLIAVGYVVALALVEVLTDTSIVLIPLLVVAPLMVAIDGAPRLVLWIGGAAVVTAVGLGWASGIGGSTRHAVGVSAVIAGTVLGWYLARARVEREHDILRSKPVLDQAARVARAMHAGQMGEWWWQLETGRVGWDDGLNRLFGMAPGEFGGTFDHWVERVHVDDRQVVVDAVAAGVAGRSTFRFDHRCVWPDGSIHWVEGLGEVSIDESDAVTGAVGLAWNVDQRHAELDERARLLEIERSARARAEFIAQAHEVLTRSVDVTEILNQVTTSAVPEVADWCAAVLAVDQPARSPLIVTAHRDAVMRDWAVEIQRQFPYDPEASFGAAKVIRTGEREVLHGLSRALEDSPHSTRSVLTTADVDSVVTVPIKGPLGVLGSLQLIRGRARPEFSTGDLELADELAARCGAALNTAILFGRQATSSAALETLQRVSGWLARAATVREVARAVLTHGMAGLRADGSALFVVDEAGTNGDGLSVFAAEGVTDGECELALRALAERCMADDRVLTERVSGTRPLWVLVTPLRVLDRTLGALVFVFDTPRQFAESELSMVFTLGSRCAGAMERASLHDRDRQISLTLQRRLLPALPPAPAWLAAGSVYRPAAGGQVGGDWYQLITRDDDSVVASVGDSVGHGVASAAAMGQLRASIATAVARDVDPAAALEVVDRFAAQEADTLSASVALALLSPGRSIRYASSGHPPMIMARAGGSSEVLEGGRRPLLGFGHGVSNCGSSSATTAFERGDTLVMYTDGLIERRRELIDVGVERLREACVRLRHVPVQQMCDELVDHMLGDSVVEDDVAVLILRHV